MSYLEENLAVQLKAYNLVFQREYKAVPGRRFSWDFYLPDVNTLVEIQGGTWVKSGHTTGKGIHRDCEKMNRAIILGYRVLNFTGEDVIGGDAIGMILELVEREMAKWKLINI